MVNKQVIGGGGRERAGKAWGREGQTPTHPRPGTRRVLYRRKDAREGHCLQGALWSHTAYEKYLHVFATLCTKLPGGHRGGGGGGCWTHQPLDGNSRTQSWHLHKSVQFVGFYLQAGGLRKQVQGGGCQEKSRRAQEVVATPAPPERPR